MYVLQPILIVTALLHEANTFAMLATLVDLVIRRWAKTSNFVLAMASSSSDGSTGLRIFSLKALGKIAASIVVKRILVSSVSTFLDALRVEADLILFTFQATKGGEVDPLTYT